MAHEFRLPDIGEGLMEAEIVAWRVDVGDEVAMDQIVVEVETDKAVVEIPIPVAGTVLHLGGAEGDVVEVGEILLVVGDPDELWPAEAQVAEASDEVASSEEAPPIVGTLDTEVTTLGVVETEDAGGPERPQALPVVRKLAKELGVDLAGLRGTGPDGRITREDVLATADEGGFPEPWVHDEDEPDEERAEVVDQGAGDAGEPAEDVHDGEEDDEPVAGEHHDGAPEPRVRQTLSRRELSRVRKVIAEHMSRSWAEIPHVTSFDEVDATRLLEVKRALTARTGVTIPIDALVVKAVVPALRAFPDFNARLDGEALVDNPSYDIGVAVDTPDGLMVVVVRDVASLTLSELSTRLAEFAEAATARTATPEQLLGQTFTVSNIGAVGGGYGTPIVPYGTTAILSVGRAVERPVARHGTVTVAPVMPLSLSYDHRIIDGAQGRRFLALVHENLAEPALFLAD
jgi:pyruvate dehydrogenase E2 component (dihydrolipoamide acetyltransferase)